ncbi:acVLRF1 family peptidyl-tRNA hydrolase [Saccharomonospora xinjiangensis]|uniref:acVLRF1 family peptidyl-tRNA hydrolase n=1 Tax=Saccharomonospora xinjiangensis TaxID=75294 RepID=UPI00106FD677|nr:acVLRF1 family peptidyl-tRNA hydrolase [Saccharomonospora xinjiangensis]QBQ60207.1 peptide chain release factor 1 [Saccharomonospora xinjiangensis]
MVRKRQAPGGGTVVEVEPERLARWLDRFAERNDGVIRTEIDPRQVRFVGGNGVTATVVVPFEPLAVEAGTQGEGLCAGVLLDHVLTPRRIGLLLVRLGGHSVGVAEGGRVTVSRTDRHLVHGRSAAGGWSQQRFARRRDGQARQALRAAADDAADILGSRVTDLDAVVLGGDRKALEELRADRRLGAVFAKAEPRVLDVVEPRRTVLDDAAERSRAVEIVVR